MKIQVIKSLKTGMYESFAYELRDWNFKFARTWLNRHESTTFVLSLLLSCQNILSMYDILWAWYLLCDATNAMQCYARQELNMNAIYMTRRMHCKKFKSILSSLNPRQASSWWTQLHAMSETRTTGSCKTHVHYYVDKVRQAPSMYIWNATIW